jgi:sialic acid synthase SpsE
MSGNHNQSLERALEIVELSTKYLEFVLGKSVKQDAKRGTDFIVDLLV